MNAFPSQPSDSPLTQSALLERSQLSCQTSWADVLLIRRQLHCTQLGRTGRKLMATLLEERRGTGQGQQQLMWTQTALSQRMKRRSVLVLSPQPVVHVHCFG
jgi:hypothetical protein